MISEEAKVIKIVKKSLPAVFSILILSKQKNKYQLTGEGSGFFISQDGLALTNRHVVSNKNEKYQALTHKNEILNIKVLTKDPINDIAILKVCSNQDNCNFPYIKLGDSQNINIGQTIITIGNALSEFHNSVSKGIVSGIFRNILKEGTKKETAHNLRGLIQTDSAINPGMSGGPMLNLKGEVVGINALVLEGAESIGFAIPINQAKKDIQKYKNNGKIETPYLGVRYVIINPEVKKKYNLKSSYGAWLVKENLPHDFAVVKNSPAQKAGLQENDIILEFNGIKINEKNNLDLLVQQSKVGQKVNLIILRDGKILFKDVILEQKEY